MIISEISPCQKNKDRFNIYADGEFVCALFLDTIADYSLKKGRELSKQELEKILYEDGVKKCFVKGCALLAIRSRAAKELADKLVEKGYEKEQVSSAMAMLKERGYIDDTAFGLEYAEYLQKKGYGGFALKQRLIQKGIDSSTINRVMDMLRPQDNEAAAEEYGRRVYARVKREDDEFKRKQKFLASMARHGFDYSLAKEIYSRMVEDID